jgi:PAS domain S-box-containing protein
MIAKELEQQALYLRTVLNSAPDAILTLDAQYRIVMCNPGAEKLFGYSGEEMIGRNIDELISGPDRFNEAKSFSQQALTGKSIPCIETVRYRKDGTLVNVIMAGAPILIENKIIGAVAVYTDWS